MQLDVTNEIPDLNEQLRGVYSHLNGDLTPLMQDIGTLLLRSTSDRFETKEDPDGISWKQLAPSTLQTKTNINKKNRANVGILVESGNLADSFSQKGAMQVFQDRVIIGSDEEYAPYHQVGTKHMPKRPFLGLSSDDKSEILNALNEFIEEAWRG